MIYEDVLNQMNEDELRNYAGYLQKYICSLVRENRIRRDIAEVYNSLSLLKADEVSAAVEETRLSKKIEDIEDAMRAKYGSTPAYDIPTCEVSDGK
jgi:phosphoenolpyruvate synthase/pyruvate phosphate dikinase